MVDRGASSRCSGKQRSSCGSCEFDAEYREHLAGKHLGVVPVRPPSGTYHQQPGSHLSIDTRLSELSLDCHGHLIEAGSDGLSSQSPRHKTTCANKVNKPNCYITSPFKQGYNNPKSAPHNQMIDPGLELKTVTRDSINRVRQQFRRPKQPPQPPLYTQRLKKAKIKSTGRPVSGTGPSIQQCKGIQAGKRVISRTRAPIVYFQDEHPLITEMRRPESSIHCTSRASSVTDQDSFLDECFDEDHDSTCDSFIRDELHKPSNDNRYPPCVGSDCDTDGTCKPFSDDKYHCFDDDDDERSCSKVLPSNYSCNNSRNETTQDCNESDSGTGMQADNNGRQTNNLHDITQSNNKSTDHCVHVVDCEHTPVLTVHVRTKLHNAATHCMTNKGLKISHKLDFEKDDADVDIRNDSDGCNDVLIDDDDDLDTDRIPSAVIWKNLDQLNLSMNASLSSSKDKLTSNTRNVHSASHCRDDSKVVTNHQGSRTLSRKSRKTKKNVAKPHEDQVDILRKYLSEESQRFCADLPGYFTDQFHIIQDAKKSKVLNGVQNVSKALMKYEHNINDTKKEQSTGLINGIHEETDDDYASFGVFFTFDSTSSCDVESLSGQSAASSCDVKSLSGQSEDTLHVSSESTECSVDTGFETMPSSGISHVDKHTAKNSTEHAHQVRLSVKPEELEVVAEAKLLTDPKTSNTQHCPHEPLVFSINALPSPGCLFYFAYGVDMNAKRMSLYLRGEHTRLWGVLFGFKLRFNKKGSSFDAGGFANVQLCPGSSVEGCVYTITNEELSMLDNCMGYPKHYTRTVLPVWMNNCRQPNLHGVAQYCVPAVVYVAEHHWIQQGPTDILDCTYSVSQCLKASDILTPNYVEFLHQLAA